jgi:hypothetical protein
MYVHVNTSVPDQADRGADGPRPFPPDDQVDFFLALRFANFVRVVVIRAGSAATRRRIAAVQREGWFAATRHHPTRSSTAVTAPDRRRPRAASRSDQAVAAH